MQIFDTFLFDGEFDLLEHRLRETFDLIDKFVLVEAGETFRGEPKSLLFSASHERFAWAAAKILRIALPSLGSAAATSWQRESVQRNAILAGLFDANPDDIVLILDADEIANRTLLKKLRMHGLDRPHRLAMTRHYEYLDQLAPRSACCPPPEAAFAFEADRIRCSDWNRLDACWFGRSGVAVRFCDLVGEPNSGLPPRSPYELRRRLANAPTLEDAGRHLLAVDGNARLKTKLGRVAHNELGDERARNFNFLEQAQLCAVHHHGWWYAERPKGPLPEDLQRLAQHAPQMRRPNPMPSLFLRRLMRSWAWLRYGRVLSHNFVFAIDKHLAIFLPAIAPFLFAADIIRHLGARFRWRWLRALSTDTVGRGHG